MPHTCHARDCRTPVKPELLMCRRHWYMVAPGIRTAVWRNYRAGQCDDKSPSRDWLDAADAAIGFVALREGKQISMNETRALVALGFEKFVVSWHVQLHGESSRAACLKVIASLKEAG